MNVQYHSFGTQVHNFVAPYLYIPQPPVWLSPKLISILQVGYLRLLSKMPKSDGEHNWTPLVIHYFILPHIRRDPTRILRSSKRIVVLCGKKRFHIKYHLVSHCVWFNFQPRNYQKDDCHKDCRRRPNLSTQFQIGPFRDGEWMVTTFGHRRPHVTLGNYRSLDIWLIFTHGFSACNFESSSPRRIRHFPLLRSIIWHQKDSKCRRSISRSHRPSRSFFPSKGMLINTTVISEDTFWLVFDVFRKLRRLVCHIQLTRLMHIYWFHKPVERHSKRPSSRAHQSISRPPHNKSHLRRLQFSRVCGVPHLLHWRPTRPSHRIERTCRSFGRDIIYGDDTES